VPMKKVPPGKEMDGAVWVVAAIVWMGIAGRDLRVASCWADGAQHEALFFVSLSFWVASLIDLFLKLNRCVGCWGEERVFFVGFRQAG
jgi:hypothetical protein